MTSVQNVYFKGSVVGQMAWREVSALCTAVIIGWGKSYKEHYWDNGLYLNMDCGLNNYTVSIFP